MSSDTKTFVKSLLERANERWVDALPVQSSNLIHDLAFALRKLEAEVTNEVQQSYDEGFAHGHRCVEDGCRVKH